MTVIGRFDRPSGRWYVDPLDDALAYQSVTTVQSMTSGKPWLQKHAASVAAKFCVRNIDLINAMADDNPQAAIDLIEAAAQRARELKANVGSYVHDVQEALIIDTTIPPIPDHIEGQPVEYDGETMTVTQEWVDTFCDGFTAFVADFDVEFEMAEATVVNVTHGYAGTLDWIAILKKLAVRTRLLGDTKTGYRVYPAADEQMAAYRRAEFVWLDKIGSRCRMPPVDRAAVLHLRPEYDRRYKLLEQPADEKSFQRFINRLQIIEDIEHLPKAYGRPLYPALPDGTQPPPLVEDVDVAGFNIYRKSLRAAGIRDLGQLALLTTDELLSIKGVGKAAPSACARALAAHGLTFRTDDKTNLMGVA